MNPAVADRWRALAQAAERGKDVPLRDRFAADRDRFARMSVRWDDWLLDFSKQRLDDDALALLHGLWQAADVPGWIARMRAGEPINHTEGRAALHIALRQPAGKGPILHAGKDVMPAVHTELDKVRRFCGEIHGRHWRGATGEPITDIVNIGIGGSDLGPRMATQALSAFRHPELWKAAVDMFGPYNLFTFLDRIPAAWKTYFYVAVGHPERDQPFLTERSPSTYQENLACPMLVIQGANDPRVVERESRDVVETLHGLGKTVDWYLANRAWWEGVRARYAGQRLGTVKSAA